MAKLHIDHLAAQVTERKLHSALEQLPVDRDEAYGNVMDRISSQNEAQKHLAMTTLKWITFAKEPLQTGALQLALSKATNSKEINEDLIDVEQLVSFCAGIVTIDCESGIIRHVHYTIQKYLEAKLPQAESSIEIARTCLSYLTFPVFSTPCANRDSLIDRRRKYGLSSYAASHWADHVRDGSEEHLQDVVLATFEGDGRRDSVLQLQGQGYDFRPSFNFSLLHWASYHGLSNICQALLSNYKAGNRLGWLITRKRLFPFGMFPLTEQP
jgi:hypothetical protein